MQTKQRILTVLLALCVAFTMMPLAGITGLAAYAADGKGAEGLVHIRKVFALTMK